MVYYCEVCDIIIKPKSKYKHFESNTHKEFDKCEHIKLTIENPDMNDIDSAFCAYIIQQVFIGIPCLSDGFRVYGVF